MNSSSNPYRVIILKNLDPIRIFPADDNNLNEVFDLAFDLAGGLYNGSDKFSVKIFEVKKDPSGLIESTNLLTPKN